LWRRGDCVHSRMWVIGKIGKTKNSCLLSVKSANESHHLVFWSLETLTGLRDQARGLVA